MKFHPEQEYISEVAGRLGIPYTLKTHERETITCKEKADLIGWPIEQIVKALYFHTGDYADGIIGIIVPEIGKINSTAIISQTLQMSESQAKRYQANGYTPSGMSRGTCTPFPKKSSMEQEISNLIIVDYAPTRFKLADISMGDEFSDPKRVSLQLLYQGIHTILIETFGNEKIRTFTHP